MRTQEQRDRQTLDIMSVVLGAALLWFAPLVLLAVVGGWGVLDRIAPVVLIAYVVTVVVSLGRRR